MKKITILFFLTTTLMIQAGDPGPTDDEQNKATPVLIEMLRIKDHLTGEIRKPTADELRLLMPQNPLGRSDDGLVARVNKNGDVTMNLQGRFQSAIMAKIGPDGKIVTQCVKTDEEARAFLAKKFVEENHDM